MKTLNYSVPEPGDTLRNGAEVVAIKGKAGYRHRDDFGRLWVLLAKLPDRSAPGETDWIVWDLNAERGETYNGRYFLTEKAEATAHFERS